MKNPAPKFQAPERTLQELLECRINYYKTDYNRIIEEIDKIYLNFKKDNNGMFYLRKMQETIIRLEFVAGQLSEALDFLQDVNDKKIQVKI